MISEMVYDWTLLVDLGIKKEGVALEELSVELSGKVTVQFQELIVVWAPEISDGDKVTGPHALSAASVKLAWGLAKSVKVSKNESVQLESDVTISWSWYSWSASGYWRLPKLRFGVGSDVFSRVAFELKLPIVEILQSYVRPLPVELLVIEVVSGAQKESTIVKSASGLGMTVIKCDKVSKQVPALTTCVIL